MAAQVAHDPARVAFEPFQCLTHALKLLGMGIAANLQRKPRGKAGVGLPQIHPSFLCQDRQLTARPLVKPGVRRIGDVLFHDSRVDGHAFGAVLIDDARLLPGLDRLGKQPFAPLLADPPPPARQR